MTFGSDDLAGLLVGPDREFAGFAQGLIRAWNADTFENTVNVGGTDLHNLPVKAGTEGLTYAPGDVVMLSKWKPSGRGLASYWIDGRALIPGSGRAEEAIAFLRTELARSLVDDLVAELLVSQAGQDLAAFVFGQRVHSNIVLDSDTLTGQSTFTDLSPAGPTVSDIGITEAGRAIVMMTVALGGTLPLNSNGNVSGIMGVEISGATSVAPDAAGGSLRVSHTANTGTNAANRSFGYRATYAHPVFNLNPGLHTFTAKYRNAGASTLATTFAERSMTVIAF